MRHDPADGAKRLDVADYAYVLETGRIVLSGSAVEVANNPAVAASYLGCQAASWPIALSYDHLIALQPHRDVGV